MIRHGQFVGSDNLVTGGRGKVLVRHNCRAAVLAASIVAAGVSPARSEDMGPGSTGGGAARERAFETPTAGI